MEGISIQWERTDILPSSHMKAQIFKSMRRSVSDITPSSRKQKEKVDNGSSQPRFPGSQVSVVSVQYDVPKVPSSTTVFRFRKMHTPVSSQAAVHRAKSEDKINYHSYVTNVPEYPLKRSARLERRVKEQKEERKLLQDSDQIAGNVEAHRLKGLGVGKCYMEYKPPPTAPDGYHTGRTPATTPGLLCHTPSTNPSAPPSLQPSRLDHANIKSAHFRYNADSPLRNAQNYLQRAKSFMQEDKLLSYKSQSHHMFHPSPLVHSQSPHSQDQGYSSRLQGRNQGYRGLSGQNMQESEMCPRVEDKDIGVTDKDPHVYRGYSFHERERERSYKRSNLDRENGHKTAVPETEYSHAGQESVKHVREHSYKSSKHHAGSREDRGLENEEGNKAKGHHLSEDMYQYNKNVQQFRSGGDVELLGISSGSGLLAKDKNGSNTLGGNNSAAALNLNQRINQLKAQKELTTVQMYSQRMVRLKMTQSQRKSAAPWFGSTMVVPQGLGMGYFRVRCPVTFQAPSSRSAVIPSRSAVIPADQESILLGSVSSSSTPTVPYSTADILYGSDVTKRDQADELRRNSLGELEKTKDLARQKSRELEHPNNRRPNSKSGSRRSISIDAVSFDKDPDPLKTIPSSLPPAKPSNHFRPNGIRSNLLKGEPLYSPKTTNGAAPGRDQDDLIATGTEWGYNNKSQQQSQQTPAQVAALSSPTQPPPQQQQTRVGSVPNNTNNSYPAKVVSSSSSSHQSMSSTTNNTMVPQRKYASNNMRPIVVQNNVSGKKQNNKIEEDPKYTDPMIGAPASFQQRIIELGALEGDTVRWERTKRLKKKKQDRDS